MGLSMLVCEGETTQRDKNSTPLQVAMILRAALLSRRSTDMHRDLTCVSKNDEGLEAFSMVYRKARVVESRRRTTSS